MAPGSHLVAIDGHRWSADTMHEALAGAASAKSAIALLVEKDDEFRSYELSYSGGERYPNLVRDAGVDLLAAIGRPHAAVPAEAR